MDSLVKVKYNNQPLFLGLAILIAVLFSHLSWYSYLAVLIFLHQFLLLFNSVGSIIPVRYLCGNFMCLQLLLGPVLAYNGLNEYAYFKYQMQVSEVTYFTYALPAVMLFLVGLHITAKNLQGENIDEDRIAEFVQSHATLPYIFIAIGFLSSFVGDYMPSELAFIFYLLGGFKFIGAFLLIIGNGKLKIIPLIIIFGSILVSSLSKAMFHDLLTWIIFTGFFIALKYKPKVGAKIIACCAFILLAVIIQQIKGVYRAATWVEGKEAGFSTLIKVSQMQNQKQSLFSFKSLAPNAVRINQGFIVSNIMNKVPKRVPFENGKELLLIIKSAFLPRFLAPDKLSAGDEKLFMKYTDLVINNTTSMGLSAMGDGYINFGVFGGCIFMFLLGLFYSEVLKAFERHSRYFPILILFTALIFYYPIRPDSEFQTVLGHLVKGCVIIFFIFRIWKDYFMVEPEIEETEKQLTN